MKGRYWLRVFTLLLIAAAAASPQNTALRTTDKPTESEHRRGPKGLEGWTLNSTIPDHPNEKYPFTLVIARHGRIVQRIDGDPFVWKWIFWDGARKVAYETGSLHFNLQCNLADIATGRRLASYDCFHGVPDNAPDWLQTLEGAH
jgi:hypothetical protein